MVWCLGLAAMAVVGLADGAVWDLGLAPLAILGCCWSPSLFWMVALGCIGEHVVTGVGIV